MASKYLFAGGVYVGAAAALYHFNTIHKVAVEPVKSLKSGSKFDRLAPFYDAAVGMEEFFMLYGAMRWWLLRYAQVGHVRGRGLVAVQR